MCVCVHVRVCLTGMPKVVYHAAMAINQQLGQHRGLFLGQQCAKINALYTYTELLATP